MDRGSLFREEEGRLIQKEGKIIRISGKVIRNHTINYHLKITILQVSQYIHIHVEFK